MSQALTVENVSEWLNEEIFNQVVQNHLKIEIDDFKIVLIESKLATKPGDNYLSVLFRSSVEIKFSSGEVKKLSYIVKCLLSTVFNEVMVNGLNAFPKEKKMYSDLLPAFEKLYSDVGVDVSFGPKCYFTADKPTQIIVLEDLSNYVMKEKKFGLDRSHVEWGLAWLGKFHAASMVYHRKYGDFGEDFKFGVFNPAVEETFQSYYDAYFEHYLAALRKLENGEKYAKKAEKFKGKLYSMICKTLEHDEKDFNVLCHGDMWSNNLLFLYNEDGKIDNLKLVDFQLMFWGSVAKDIYNFMMSSWQLDLKVKKFDELMKFYSNELIKSLKVLKYEGTLPTFDDLKAELDAKKFVAAGMTMEILTFTVCETPASDKNFVRMIYDNPRAEQIFAEVIPWLDSQGAYDF